MDHKSALWMGKSPDDMTGLSKANRLNDEKLMAPIVKVAPHTQDGFETLNRRARAQRQLFSKNACKEPLKRFGNDQYDDDR